MSSSKDDDIRVVVAIDFGTISSGYAYAFKSCPDEITVGKRPEGYKIPTIIKYQDESYSTVKSWGFSALPENPRRSRADDQSRPIELFKLFLFKDLAEKPFLPDKLDYKKVITDYLKKLGETIREGIQIHLQNLDFYSQVLIVLMIPVEFDYGAIAIMRDCAFNAGLMKEKDRLIFITEPEAAAVHLLNSSEKEHFLKPGDSLMVVDCGGGTVNLTSHEVLTNNRISEITESTSGNCGSRIVDKEFVKFLCRKLGKPTVALLEKDYYNSLQYMVQEFCRCVKIHFTGEKSEFRSYKIDLKKYPLIKNVLEGTKEQRLLKEADWLIGVEFGDVKGMFDPFVKNIIGLIKEQLEQQNNKCSTIMLVGGFSESKYLQARIKKEFNNIVSDISIPMQPMVAAVMGGVQYGLQCEFKPGPAGVQYGLQREFKTGPVVKRILKRTYGTDTIRRSKPGDPPSAMLPNGYTIVFDALAERGKQILVDQKVVKEFKPHSITQRSVDFDLYVTKAFDAKFCDDSVSLLCSWEIPLPKDYDDITIVFTLTFGTVEILATAEIQEADKKYPVKQIKVNYE